MPVPSLSVGPVVPVPVPVLVVIIQGLPLALVLSPVWVRVWVRVWLAVAVWDVHLTLYREPHRARWSLGDLHTCPPSQLLQCPVSPCQPCLA